MPWLFVLSEQRQQLLTIGPWERILTTWGPIYQYGLTLILEWMSNHMASKVWDDIVNPFPNSNGCTVKVWEWISDFILHFMMDVINYSCCDWRYSVLVKGGPVRNVETW